MDTQRITNATAIANPERRQFRVNSGPGCGKTTRLQHTIRNALLAMDAAGLPKYDPEQIVGVSFSVTAAQALRGKVGDAIPKENMTTVHARCYRAMSRDGKIPITEDPDVRDDWNEYVTRSGNVWAKLPAAKARYDTPGDDLEEVYTRDEDNGAVLHAEYQNFRARMTERHLWPTRVLAFARLWEDYKGATGVIDFNDMIDRGYEDFDTCPIITKNAIKRPVRILLVDETQDLAVNAARLLRKWGEADGIDTFVTVGDLNQTIYGAFGADPRVMIDPPLPKDRDKVEPHSYRLSQAGYAAAVRWINQLPIHGSMDFTPTDEPGHVYRINNVTWRSPEPLIPLIDRLITEGTDADRLRGSLVQIQVSAAYMLPPICKLLKQAGIKFHNPYRPAAGAWNPVTGTMDRVLAFLRPCEGVWGTDAAFWTVKDFWAWAQWLGKDVYAVHGGKTALIKWIADQPTLNREMEYSELLQWFSEDAVNAMSEPDVTWFRNHVVASHRESLLFPLAIAEKRGLGALRTAPDVIVGTTYSLKGTQTKDSILFPDLSPAAWREFMNPHTRQNVVFPFYVGLTRSWHDLYLCAASTPVAVRWL